MDNVLLVVMPFGAIQSPPVGVSLIKAQLANEGIGCDVAYFNLAFAEAVGIDNYLGLLEVSGEIFAGEWLFSHTLFSDKELDPQGYIQNVLYNNQLLPPTTTQIVLNMLPFADPFIDHCMTSVDWDRYRIIGFTSMFEQNLSSLSLAKRIKERYPDKIVVMGGANCTGPMGVQLHKSFPFLDYVSTGEADLSFLELSKKILAQRHHRPHVPGFVRRKDQASIDDGPAQLIRQMDTLPYPNYDDFFQQLHASRLPQSLVNTIMMETSRGCWWGQKHQCMFCGINPRDIRFRSKSAERSLDEMMHLSARYGLSSIMVVDNVMSHEYFRTLLKDLKRKKLGISLFYETKANLTKNEVELLHDAGVVLIQPGIESFSANTLGLLRKGVNPLQNIRLLKWCKEHDLHPSWNLLYGYPGETSRDYVQTRELTALVTHLTPPMVYGWVRMYRFSPIFYDPEKYGFRDVRPASAYRYIYPFDKQALTELAYVFDFDFDGKEKLDRWAQPVHEAVDQWQQWHSTSKLEAVFKSDDLLEVHDTRPNRSFSMYRFNRLEKEIIEYCDDMRSIPAIMKYLQGRHDGSAPSVSWLRNFINSLLQNKLMVGWNDRYLSLILQPSKERRSIV